MRYLITMKYDGSKFNGFQRLNKGCSVQKTIEDALSIIDGDTVLLKGAGRTDSGVHALGQTAHFDMKREFSCDKLKQILNKMIAPYILITDVKRVSEDFHARFNVREKEYVYIINMGEASPFMEDYSLYYPYQLDIKLMQEGAKLFIGTHDYHNFVSGERDSYECIINNIVFEEDCNMLKIHFYGGAFYRYMVRHLVGTLLMLGRKKISLDDIKDALEYPNVKKDFMVAPAKGLYLVKVSY